MDLNYDLTKINGGAFREVTHCPALDEYGNPLLGDDGAPVLELSPMTDALIYYTWFVGMANITRRNHAEFYRRAKLLECTVGALTVTPPRRYDRSLWMRDENGDHLLANLERDDEYVVALREHIADVHGIGESERWRDTENNIVAMVTWDQTGDFDIVIDDRSGVPAYFARRVSRPPSAASVPFVITLDDVRAHIGLQTNAAEKRRAKFDAWLLALLAPVKATDATHSAGAA